MPPIEEALPKPMWDEDVELQETWEVCLKATKIMSGHGPQGRGSAAGEELAVGLHKLLETCLPGIKQKGGASVMEMRNLEGRGMRRGIVYPFMECKESTGHQCIGVASLWLIFWAG